MKYEEGKYNIESQLIKLILQ